MHRQRRVHHEDIGLRADQPDRRKVGLRVKADLRVECAIGGENGIVADEERIAIGDCMGDGLAGNVAAGTGAVLDHQRLAKGPLHRPREYAGEHVACSAGREGNDQSDGTDGKIGSPGPRRSRQKCETGEPPDNHTNCTAMAPSAPKSACNVSPFCACTTRVNEPASTRCPGSSATPCEPSLLASQATPSAGWPSTPAATPVSSISEFLYMMPPTQRKSTSSGPTGRPPTTMPAAAPLSATVSTILRGSCSRASTISSDGMTYSVARSTSARPTPGPFSGLPMMKASSISTRGRQ